MRWEKLLGKLWAPLAAAAYPFDHAQGTVSLAQFTIGRLPPADDIGATIGTVQEAAEKFYGVYARVMGRLVHRAEEIEAAPPSSPTEGPRAGDEDKEPRAEHAEP